MARRGLKVAEVAQRLGWSGPTVRRHVGQDLKAVPHTRPLLITEASVEEVRQEALGRLGHADIHPQDESTRQTQIEHLRNEIEELREENERLRRSLQLVRVANRAYDEALAEFTEPKIPNN